MENDPSLSYPLMQEQVPSTTLLVSAVVLISSACIIHILRKDKRDTRGVHAAIYEAKGLFLAFVFATLLTTALTAYAKFYAGRLRPHFFARSENKNARMSYPSGHSSYSFSTCIVFSLFSLTQIRFFSLHPTKQRNPFCKVVVSTVIPFAGAGFVAISRTRDYFHNFSDINAGAILGIFCAIVSYYSIFPMPWSPRSKTPRAILALIDEKASLEEERDTLLST